MRDLNNLLTQLLTAQNASGCGMKVQDQTGDNDAWVVEVLMDLKHIYGAVDPSPQGIYALQRTCMWVCNQASDDIDDVEAKTGFPKRIVRFIDKWDDFPALAFEGMQFKYADSGTVPPAGETDTQTQPTIISSCLNFLDVFNYIRANRRSVQVRETDTVDNLLKLLVVNNNNDENDDDERAELKRRCKKNIEFIQELLSHISGELDAETARRSTCNHTPRCKKLTASAPAIQKAQKHLTKLILSLMRVKESLNRSWAGTREKEKEAWTVRRWVSLSKSAWFWGLLMGADEIVGKIGSGVWVDEGGQRQECWRAGTYGFEDGLEKIV